MTDWTRTTKAVRCPICRKDSWCIINQKAQVVICMREVSPKPKAMKDGSLGWIHPLPTSSNWTPPPEPKRPDPPTINCRRLIEEWSQKTQPEWVHRLADDLKVSVYALQTMRVCWSAEHRAWAWPMFDAYDNMVGIRLRTEEGTKFAVRGSHAGCFIPTQFPSAMALVAEGPTDTCAGLDLGFYTVGRPSCSGGVDILRKFFRKVGVTRAAIICDNDGPGVNGADMLARHLGVQSALLVLPTKDLREFVSLGGDHNLLQTYLETNTWR